MNTEPAITPLELAAAPGAISRRRRSSTCAGARSVRRAIARDRGRDQARTRDSGRLGARPRAVAPRRRVLRARSRSRSRRRACVARARLRRAPSGRRSRSVARQRRQASCRTRRRPAGSRARGRRSTASPVRGSCGASSIRPPSFSTCPQAEVRAFADTPRRDAVRRCRTSPYGAQRRSVQLRRVHPHPRARRPALDRLATIVRGADTGALVARAAVARPAGGVARTVGDVRRRSRDAARGHARCTTRSTLWCRERSAGGRGCERQREIAPRPPTTRRGVPLLAAARLHQLRRPRGPDRDHASRARRRAALDLRVAVPARAQLLHGAAGPGGAAARHLHRLAHAPHVGRHRRGRAVRAAVARDPRRAVVALHGVWRRRRRSPACSTASSRRSSRSCCTPRGASARGRSSTRRCG